MSFLAAAIQLNSTSNEQASIAEATRLVELAAERGAAFVATPENTNFLGPHEEKVGRAQPLGGATCRHFSQLAGDLGIHLLLGSFNERGPDRGHCYNTSVLFGPEGQQLSFYRKIHLFDVDVSDDVRFRESETVVAGEEVVVVPTPLAGLGLSICYDLRFGELYRLLVQRGAELLCVPSAFTLTTGKDHWDVLVQARAVETQCFVVAPAQWGRHDDDGLRESFGHTMIVDPWGVVLAMASEGTGLALAEIDMARLRTVRKSIPVADHRRLPEFLPPS
jgi:predicted amidohydrolase